MPFVDYVALSTKQQRDVRALHPSLIHGNHRFWVTKKGEISRRKGDHDWTIAYAERVHANLKKMIAGEDVRSKGDLQDFKTADFTLSQD